MKRATIIYLFAPREKNQENDYFFNKDACFLNFHIFEYPNSKSILLLKLDKLPSVRLKPASSKADTTHLYGFDPKIL